MTHFLLNMIESHMYLVKYSFRYVTILPIHWRPEFCLVRKSLDTAVGSSAKHLFP